MRKSRFTEVQIIQILKRVEAVMSVADICRQHSIFDTTFYKWKWKYSGLEVSEARRLKLLEQENARLKRLVAEQALDIVVLREVIPKYL
ncbi:transposase [Desulfocurvibacter africanus]|uniref:transposase n=1 Tax=Desulfocurvibacter africanus TaxID=873 RepID=UPI002FD9F8CE